MKPQQRSTVGKFLSLVKFSHTVFALPFALLGVGIALRDRLMYGPDFRWADEGHKLLLVLVCMVTARNAAMAFNRWADRRWDALNPRTAIRELPSGAITERAALGFVVVNCVAFLVATWFINPLCFALAPVALGVVLGYSYTKRFTALCHLVLGIGLGLAPVGAYLALRGQFAPEPVLLGCAVLAWVAGFDIIYALQDAAFDRAQRLHSLPAWLGPKRALTLSTALHVLCAALLLEFTNRMGGGWFAWLGFGLFALLLVRQHLLVKPHDFSRVNLAFFTLNGVGSVAFGVLNLLDIWAIVRGWYSPLS
jgi:4-hydroxybenzoate polyprenyltransferase